MLRPIEVKIVVELSDDTKKALAGFLSTKPAALTEATEVQAAPENKTAKGKAGKAATVKVDEVKVAPVGEEADAQEEVDIFATPAATPAKQAKVTHDDALKALRKVQADKGMAAALEIIKPLGCTNVKELKQEHWAPVIEACQKALA